MTHLLLCCRVPVNKRCRNTNQSLTFTDKDVAAGSVDAERPVVAECAGQCLFSVLAESISVGSQQPDVIFTIYMQA
jgi:hypothetical protein